MKHRNQSVNARDYSLDNLRSFLTALVTIQHTAVCHGGFGHEPLRSSCFPTSSLILIAFNLASCNILHDVPSSCVGTLLSTFAAPCRNHACTGPRNIKGVHVTAISPCHFEQLRYPEFRIFYPIGTTFPILSIQPGTHTAFLVHPLVSLAVEILVDGICDDAQFPIWKLLGPVLLTIIVGHIHL